MLLVIMTSCIHFREINFKDQGHSLKVVKHLLNHWVAAPCSYLRNMNISRPIQNDISSRPTYAWWSCTMHNIMQPATQSHTLFTENLKPLTSLLLLYLHKQTAIKPHWRSWLNNPCMVVVPTLHAAAGRKDWHSLTTDNHAPLTYSPKYPQKLPQIPGHELTLYTHVSTCSTAISHCYSTT